MAVGSNCVPETVFWVFFLFLFLFWGGGGGVGGVLFCLFTADA